MTYANSDGSDQHAHLNSLIRSFPFRRCILQNVFILLAGHDGPKQTAHAHSDLLCPCMHYENMPIQIY